MNCDDCVFVGSNRCCMIGKHYLPRGEGPECTIEDKRRAKLAEQVGFDPWHERHKRRVRARALSILASGNVCAWRCLDGLPEYFCINGEECWTCEPAWAYALAEEAEP